MGGGRGGGSAHRAPLPVAAPARIKKCRAPLGVGCTQKSLPSGGSGGSSCGFQGRAGREGSGAGLGSLSLSLLFSNRRRGSARVRRGRLPGWLRLCPYPQARGGSAPCRLRAQVVPRGLDPCDSPAAPGHARTSRLARWKPVSAHRPRRSGTRKGAGHGVERAKVPKRSWASRTGATSWAFLHCTHLHSPSEDGLLRRTQLTLLLDWAELSEVESRQSDEAVAFSVRLGDHNFDNCALRNAAEILQSPPLRGLPRGDAEGLGKEEGRRHSLAGPPRGGRPAEHWRASAWTTSPTEEDPEAF
ncbi:uncharacterized protein [Sagmatias obliquidens]|uniref:uncharacterized protein n=1 Tax=Sagmatias obliquidens TaxID=3371155 RepID=UPI000F440F96|nr:uncharacterized protein SMPD5 [Lagenorhynchus obliquidens]